MSLFVPPYPPARYTSDDPELSAWLRRGDDPPDYTRPAAPCTTIWPTSSRPTATTASTASTSLPTAGGPGPHFHRAMSEAFFVLSGRIKLYDGQRLDRRAPGRLPVRPARRRARLPQRGRRARIDLDSVCSRRAARALLRGHRSAGRPDRRRASRVVHPATTTSSSIHASRHAERCAVVIPCARLLSDQ